MTINNKANRILPVSDGAVPSSATGAAANDDVIDPGVCIPLGPKRRSLYVNKTANMFYTQNGDFVTMDSDRKRLIDSGKTIISAEDHFPENTHGGPGGTTVINVDDLRRDTQERVRERQLEQVLYGGHDPYGPTPGGGLSVRGRRDNNTDDSSSGLQIVIHCYY